MAVVLSHDTALRLVRTWDFVPHAPAGILSPGFDADRLSDSNLPADSRPLDPGDFVAADRPAPDRMRALLDVPSPFAAPDAASDVPACGLFSSPIDILVSRRDRRSQSSAIRSHVWGRPLARGDLLFVQDGLYSCGPELVFAQMAATWGLERLAQLGCELTGSYALNPTSRFGVSARPPATTVERMRALLDSHGGDRGVERGRTVLDWVLPGSASPMEARIGLFFTMPFARGGRRIKRPVLNMRYDLDGVARQVTDKSFFRGDLCWPEEGIAVEYDSDAAHTGSDRIARDAQRRNALAALGVTVIVVTRMQAFDYRELSRVAAVVEHLLGLHPRVRRADQDARCRRLHAALFGANASNAVG